MAALHSLLAIYGAFDQSVVEANDPDWTARVEQFLPGTTGEHQRGWFSQVRHLVARLAPDVVAGQFPDLESALDELIATADYMSGFADPPELEAEAGPPPLTTTDIAQLVYAVAVGVRLAPLAPATNVDFSAFEGGADRFGPILGLAAEPRSTIYRAAGQYRGPRSAQTRALQADRLLRLTLMGLISFQSWPSLMTRALQQGLVSLEVATAPIALAGITTGAVHPDKGSRATSSVTTVGGHYCAVLTTDCWQVENGLTVEAVKEIVDPRNWARLSAFFCQMDRLEPDSRGASQVLEHVSTDQTIYQLKTALKNWRGVYGDGAVINYELADIRAGTGDTGLVLVDSGYIHILDNTLPNGNLNGVRIKTSKMVAIEGMSVTATSMLVLSLGWAAAGNAMLFDNAVNQPQGVPLVPWKVSPETPGGSAGKGNGTPSQPGSPLPHAPPVATAALFKEAARMWADCVHTTTADAMTIVDQWYKGGLTVQHLVDYTSTVGGRLASEPWRYLNEMNKRLPAAPSPKPAPQKAEGGSP